MVAWDTTHEHERIGKMKESSRGEGDASDDAAIPIVKYRCVRDWLEMESSVYVRMPSRVSESLRPAVFRNPDAFHPLCTRLHRYSHTPPHTLCRSACALCNVAVALPAAWELGRCPRCVCVCVCAVR